MAVLGEQRVELIDASGKRHDPALLQIKGTAVDTMVRDAVQRRIVLTVDAPSVAGGDALTVNGASLVDADLDDATPAAPAGGENVFWQKDASSPANISAYVREATALLRGILQLAGQLGGSAAAPDVRGVRETAGPTLLALGAVADGEFLKRVGATVVGAAGGGGDNVSVNGVAAVDADFDNLTPAAPVGGLNVRWQKDALTPNNISAYIGFDENNNEILVFLANAAAVNEFRIQNKPTGTDPVFESQGGDANVGIQLSTKGIRYVYINNDGEIVTQGRAVTMTSGARKTFVHGAADSGFRLGPNSGNPTAPLDGDLWYESTTAKFKKRQAGVTSDMDTGGGLTKIAGASGAAGADTTWLVLAANAADITGVTQTVVMTITGVGVGRYRMTCMLIYQTTALTTGIDVSVNHTGTTTQWLMEHRLSGTGAAASTAAASEVAANVSGNIYESQGSRTKNAVIGAGTVSVATIDADHLSTIEGFFVVSVSGDLEIKMAAEAAGLVCRAMQGSNIRLEKLS